MSRRGFLRTAAAAVAATRFPAGRSLAAPPAAGQKIRVALVGYGMRGRFLLGGLMDEQLVALCETDDERLAAAKTKVAERFPDVRGFVDHRQLLAAMAGEIDAVIVATPDHSHACIAAAAMNAGKHVFCEKPLTWSIAEARALTEQAARGGVITQLGIQGHSGEGFRRLCECVAADVIGPVREAWVWSGNHYVFGGTAGRPPAEPVPPGLHWDEWLGPAPHREYHKGLHPLYWRSWREFGTGKLGDQACHILDGLFAVCRLDQAPQYRVEALDVVGGTAEMFPLSAALRWQFPARGELPPLTLNWCDSRVDNADPQQTDKEGQPLKTVARRHPIVAEIERAHGVQLGDEGTLYIGERGVIYTDTYIGGFKVFPDTLRPVAAAVPKTLPRLKGNLPEFFAACRGGARPGAHFGYGGPLTEMVLTGHLAMRAGVGQPVDWDVATARCTNRPELDQFVGRTPRPGWT